MGVERTIVAILSCRSPLNNKPMILRSFEELFACPLPKRTYSSSRVDLELPRP